MFARPCMVVCMATAFAIWASCWRSRCTEAAANANSDSADAMHGAKQHGITAIAFHLRGIAYLAFCIRIMPSLSGFGLWAALTPLEGLIGAFHMLPDLNLPF